MMHDRVHGIGAVRDERVRARLSGAPPVSSGLREALRPDRLRALLEPLRGPELPLADEQLLPTFARLVWTAVAEPGDGDAGLLTAVFGPESSLWVSEPGSSRWAALADAPELAGADLAGALARWAPRWGLERVGALCHAATTVGVRFIVPEDRVWPRQLDHLGVHAPMGLWVRGSVDLLGASRASVALVGARASTAYGDGAAAELGAGAVDHGLAVVSGGAYGIDACSHRSALASGGATIAVLAGGADRLYPAGNRQLLERIIDQGAIVTELPCGQAPTRWRFLQRNRLIAALAQATAVVEAGARSGSLNTANHAQQLGRALGAVPGSITSAASAGCHRLLRSREAELIAGTDDLLALWRSGAQQLEIEGASGAELDVPLPLFDEPEPSVARSGVSARAVRVWDALRPRKRMGIGEIAKLSGLAPADVRGALAELELGGGADENPQGWRRTGGHAT
ncbi:Rossmann fold nucleotide-binding protein Smf possibly involved in DNA uptake [Gulosibacter sp. 10]|nr:Rossmann fold nucleotide-binding protein Smf possibly involved in DNA uptake [Gulosibacter sp. 10]